MTEGKYGVHSAAENFPLLDESRYADLRRDIENQGQREPITLYDGKVLDGRNRLRACCDLGIDPLVADKTAEIGDPYAYVWSLNGERRDLAGNEQRYLIWQACREGSAAFQAEKQRIADEANRKRAEATKAQHAISNPRAGERVKSGTCTDSTTTKPEPTPAKEQAKTRAAKATASHTDMGAVARMDALKKAAPDLAEQVRIGEMSAASAQREAKRRKLKKTLDAVAAREVEAPSGEYDVIVIDPPWPMEKIERDCHPNQPKSLDYPTMTERELEALCIPVAKDCHVWLWTTHKFLPMAFKLLTEWELKYVCTFVWHKPGGMQPFGLPQYNAEFALYARRGNPSFIDLKAFPVCFTGKRGAHSEKPIEFYDMVRRVTAGRRLDMFSRRHIQGFSGWGKEAAS